MRVADCYRIILCACGVRVGALHKSLTMDTMAAPSAAGSWLLAQIGYLMLCISNRTPSNLRSLHHIVGSLVLIFLVLCRPARAKVFAQQMSSRIVQTQYGRVRGVLSTLPNSHLKPVEAYLGMSYASILGGDLRFMPPTSPMDKWTEIKAAIKFKPVCPQRLPDIKSMQETLPIGRVEHFERLIPFLEDQAEECLNLNVYVPTGNLVNSYCNEIQCRNLIS